MKHDTQELCGADNGRGFNQTTASGRPFWVQDPRPEDVRIEDIAAQLSRICRFNGALKDEIQIYSVAQHSVLVSQHVPEEFALEALLHDAAEAYLGDMIKPIKALHRGRKQHELRVDAAIRERFGLPEKMSPEVKEQDYRAVLTEHRDLQNDLGEVDWGLENVKAEPWTEQIIPVLPSEARRMFMERFNGLYKGD